MAIYKRFIILLGIVIVYTLSHLIILAFFYKLDLFNVRPHNVINSGTDLKPEAHVDKWSAFIPRSSSIKVDSKLLQHLQRYNSSLPTNYTPAWSKSAQHADKKWKETMPRFVLNYFHNKRDGIFVECGAFDGHFISNTLMLERYHNWTGLLIEADPAVTKILKKRNRKAWVADVCISPQRHPMKVDMTGASTVLGHGYIPNDVIAKERKNKKLYTRKFEVQCYPLDMLLDAVGITYIDYFSLDVEGIELKILKTIPWDRITIQLISVEVRPENKKGIQHYLETVGYNKIKEIVVPGDFIHDHVYELVNADQNLVSKKLVKVF